jgi:hypothetical protein
MPIGLTSQGAKTPPPVPAFDGNVANIVWGGRVESVTGVAPQNLGPANSLITEKDTWFTTAGTPGPKDIVVSLFKREPALAVVGKAIAGNIGKQ